MAINWSLLGPALAADPGAAFQTGFEKGATRAALGTLGTDPTNEKALGALAMFDPETAASYRERGRQEQFRKGALAAYDPVTGDVDPAAMRQAYVGAGDVGGAMQFDAQQAETAAARRKAQLEQVQTVARLLDDATDDASYQRSLATAQQIGLDVSTAPKQFDPAWIDQQKQIVSALGDEEKLTSFQREAISAGYELGSPEYRQLFLEKMAQPRFMTGPNGQPIVVTPNIGGGAGGAPAPGPDDVAEAMSDPQARQEFMEFFGKAPEAFQQGGASPSNGSPTFP